MENVKVIIWGLGAMGSGMADMLLKKRAWTSSALREEEQSWAKACTITLRLPGDCPDVIIGTLRM